MEVAHLEKCDNFILPRVARKCIKHATMQLAHALLLLCTFQDNDIDQRSNIDYIDLYVS